MPAVTRLRRATLERAPRLHVGPKGNTSTLNTAASQLLTQEGEMFAFVLVKEGKLVLQPLPAEPGLLGVAKICTRAKGGGAYIHISASQFAAVNAVSGEDLIGRWEDSEGYMVFEKASSEEESGSPAPSSDSSLNTSKSGIGLTHSDGFDVNGGAL